jgi:hypothetical protein
MNVAGFVHFGPSGGSVTSRRNTTSKPASTAAPHTSPWLPKGYVQNFRQAAYGLRQ